MLRFGGSELESKVVDGGNREGGISGGLDDLTSPPMERYAVRNDNVIRLIQPGAFDDQLTEVLLNKGRVSFSRRRCRPRSLKHADLKTRTATAA